MLRPTTIRINLFQSGKENPVSRSQAKVVASAILAQGTVHIVYLDFSNIREIGQGFADQLFRVFANDHPDILLHPINCNDAIMLMIRHVCGRYHTVD